MLKEQVLEVNPENSDSYAEYDLAKIIDLKTLQSLTDDLSHITQMVSAVLDLKGNVLVQSGWQAVCTKFHRVNPQTAQNCRESDLMLSRGVKRGEFRTYKCKNNLWDIVTPLYIGKRHVGNIYSGQFFFDDEEIDYEQFAAQADKYGFDKKEYLAALSCVPRINRDRVNQLMVFFTKISEIISTMGYNNLQLSKAVADQKKVEEALARAKSGLEIAVKNRTAELTRANRELQLRATILDKATEAILLSDINDIYIYANEAACHLFGYTKEEFVGLTVPQIIAPRDLYHYKDWTPELRAKGELKLELYNQRKDKSVFPAEAHVHLIKIGRKKYIISIIRDITERRQALEKLKLKEMQLETIFDALTEEISLLDPYGRVLKTNPASEQISGIKPAEIEGRIPETGLFKFKTVLLDGRELSLDQSPIFQAIRKKKAIKEEVKQVWPDGSTRWVVLNAIPLLDESRQMTGVVQTATDVTDHRRIEEQREYFTRQLIQVQEEERKRISRDLHDEIAQKLALVSLELDALQEKEKHLPPDILLNLSKIRDMTNSTLQDVRRFSHELRPSVLEHFGIAEALDLIIDEMNLRDQTQVTVDISGFQKRLPEEIEIALFRIAQEALNNIRKHSKATRSKVSLKFTNNSVRLSISDNGKGFDTRKIQDYSTKNGLGLIGMMERAQLIGGSLQIKSLPGIGTTISVEVPSGDSLQV